MVESESFESFGLHEVLVENELRITNYELRITNYELRITNLNLIRNPQLLIDSLHVAKSEIVASKSNELFMRTSFFNFTFRQNNNFISISYGT